MDIFHVLLPPTAAHIARLRRRLKLLRSATQLALASGVSVSLLLIVGFVCAFADLHHKYGAALLCVVTLCLLGATLFELGREVRIGISEARSLSMRRARGACREIRQRALSSAGSLDGTAQECVSLLVPSLLNAK